MILLNVFSKRFRIGKEKRINKQKHGGEKWNERMISRNELLFFLRKRNWREKVLYYFWCLAHHHWLGFRWRWWNENKFSKSKIQICWFVYIALVSFWFVQLRCDTQWFQMQIISRNIMKNAILFFLSSVAVENVEEKCCLIFLLLCYDSFFWVKISVCFENTHITTTTTLSELSFASIDCVLLLFSTINGFSHCV